ncbi:zinc ribbon domain-containing protein [Metabacillus halosaccharovorans]|uniref:Zinc-ribbon domain-containing protein n=1 Tax=Metabacillus halosaccharovorans TaxID=930124 RepID=A0ABT3DC86_9BACI|nr:zinc-ribbon domain-containing protein [Metabacillus halosaccharovorans]MCV9884468.1 zinc-ribbon domain-containing protein [Metabacillus halosaccharovorans]
MQFCKECGNKMKEGAQFCNNCGTSVGQTKETSRVTPKPKKPMTKKTKLLLIIGGAAVILLFGGYKVGEALTSESRLIEKFENALNENDAKAVAKLLTSNDKKVKINETSVKGLLKYYKENPEEIRDTIDTLETQSKVLRTENPMEELELEDLLNEFAGDSLVNLEKDGKFLLYDNYQLNIDPVYLELGTNYKDTSLFVDGKEVGMADKPEYVSTFGPFLPGYHKIEAKLKTDFIDLAVEEEVFLNEVNEKQNEYVEIDADEVTVSLPEGMEGSVSLLINGKDVGVNPLENPTFGPVLTDGTMKVQVVSEFPWGKITSLETPITSDYVQVNVIDDTVREQLMNTAHEFNMQRGEAFAKMDASKLIVATEEYTDMVIEEAKYFQEQGQNVKLQYLSTNFDVGSTGLEKQDGKWVAYISGEVKTKQTFSYGEFDSEMEENVMTTRFYFVYDEKNKKWLVNTIGDSFEYDPSNAKELVAKEPKTYTTKWSTETEETVEATTNSTENADLTNSGNAPEELVNLTEDYLNGLVSAINNKDFNDVKPYLLEGSDLYQDQQNLVKNLGEKNIKEQIVSADVTDYWSEGGEADVHTKERVKIIYNDGTSETKEYEWIYSGVSIGSEMFFERISEKE